MRAELILNASRQCKQIDQCSVHLNCRKTRIKIPSECLNAGRLLVYIVQFCTLKIDKMKKLLKMMNPRTIIKLVGLRSKSGSLGN
jgi:hypothetical protein